jgi:hypothetical protein
MCGGLGKLEDVAKTLCNGGLEVPERRSLTVRDEIIKAMIGRVKIWSTLAYYISVRLRMHGWQPEHMTLAIFQMLNMEEK